MAQYAEPVDIANRALQIAGATRIDSMDENSKNAAEANFAYDKVRKAELSTNAWRFAIRRTAVRPIDTTSLLFTPPAYSATVIYQQGAIVTYDGIYWSSAFPVNFNHTPGDGPQWVPFFGSRQVTPYDDELTYYAGELVYCGDGDPLLQNFTKVFVALGNGIATDPTDTQAYDAAVTYGRGDTVTYSASTYISLIPNNVAQTPASTYAAWAVATTYALNALVVDIDTGRIYKSLANSNTGNPLTDTTKWTPNTTSPYFQPWLTWTGANQNLQWATLPTGYDLSTLAYLYPANASPGAQVRNIFPLPHGFVRLAPQEPMIGQFGVLGGPLGNNAQDWEMGDNYFASETDTPIVIRFVADVAYVPSMHTLFCEGVAARLGAELIPALTQSSSKLADAASIYSSKICLARLQNAIEMGPVEQPEDELIAVRL